MEKLRVAGERIGLLNRIDDHCQFADRSLRADGTDRAGDVFGLREEVADQEEPSIATGAGNAGGKAAWEGPCRRSSVAIASAKRSTTPCIASGLVRPSRPARSPPRTQRSGESQRQQSRRSIFETGARLDANCIEAERSNQIQTVCAASHSRSRTKARSSRAERRQSTRDDGSPERNGRNCQKVSPEPPRGDGHARRASQSAQRGAPR